MMIMMILLWRMMMLLLSLCHFYVASFFFGGGWVRDREIFGVFALLDIAASTSNDLFSPLRVLEVPLYPIFIITLLLTHLSLSHTDAPQSFKTRSSLSPSLSLSQALRQESASKFPKEHVGNKQVNIGRK
jgi:hypothetical protein